MANTTKYMSLSTYTANAYPIHPLFAISRVRTSTAVTVHMVPTACNVPTRSPPYKHNIHSLKPSDFKIGD